MRNVVRMVSIASVLLVLTHCLLMKGQDQEQQDSAFILRQNVHLVVVPVAVKQRDGSLLMDLSEKDFRVFDNGKERPVSYFANDLTPLAVVVLLDIGMPDKALQEVVKSLPSLANAFGPSDLESLYVFDNQIQLVQDFTSEGGLLVKAVEQLKPAGADPAITGGPLRAGGPRIDGKDISNPGAVSIPSPKPGKRLTDALYTAVQRLKNQPAERRRVVLLVSDGINGGDNEIKKNEVMDGLGISNITVYAVSTGSGWFAKREDLLSRLSRQTGGDVAFVRHKGPLEAAYFAMMNQARNSYVLGFTPVKLDGQYHDIEVRTDRKDVRVIARSQFFAPPLGPAHPGKPESTSLP